MHECVMTREAHCPHNTEGVMNNTPDPGDTGPLVVITVTDTCTANQLCALCRHSAQMWAHCRGARGAACGLEVGSLLTRLWRCLRRGSDDGGTDPSRSALADKRPSRPRKNAKDVPCPPASVCRANRPARTQRARCGCPRHKAVKTVHAQPMH